MTFFQELKRRNVFKVAASYAIVAWIVLQVVATTSPALNIPAWVLSFVAIALLLGFPVALFIAWAYEMTPDGLKPTAEVPLESSIRAQASQKMNYLMIGGLAVLLVFVMVDQYVLEEGAPETAAASIAEAGAPPVAEATIAAPAVSELSIAVLPFTNLSSDQEQEYFSDGLAEELLNKLAQVDGLQVAARTSSFYFKGRNEDMRTIGETLGVKHILEGSVRKGGAQLRISARLINAADGYQLWNDDYDGDLTDIFALQDQIASDVTTALSVTLGAGQFDRPGMTRNPEAYDLYLQGTAQWRVNGITSEALNSAVAYLRQAVTVDPEFGIAWMALRVAYLNAVINLPTEQTRDFPPLAEEAFARARNVAPDMPNLLLVDAVVERSVGNWAASEAIYQQLLQGTGAQSVGVNAGYGGLLATVGRSADALPYLMRAARLDPLSAQPSIALTRTLLDLDRVDEANAEADRAMALGNVGNNVFLGALKMLAAYTVGDPALAAQYVRAGGAPPGQGFIDVADLLAAGDNAAAREKMHAMMEQDVSPVTAAALMIPATLAGEPGYAMQMVIDRYGVTGNPAASVGQLGMWLGVAAPMRQLPAFKDWVREAGLVEYWRSIGNWGDHCRPVNDDFECF